MEEYLKNYIQQKFTPEEVVEIKKKLRRNTSQRAEILGEVYEHYLYWNKNSNIKTFLSMYKNTKANQELFKKSKAYYPPMEVRVLAVKLSFLSVSDLYFVVSMAKDMRVRKQNFNKWLFWAIKAQKELST